MPDPITLKHIGPDDFALLMAVPEGLFDHPLRPDQARAFLADPMHECVLAFAGELAVGMASGTVLLHPDKAPAMFINEVGVRESHRRQGIGRQMTEHLIAMARNRGCKGIWLATEGDNAAARALYRSLAARETGEIVVYDWDGAMDE